MATLIPVPTDDCEVPLVAQSEPTGVSLEEIDPLDCDQDYIGAAIIGDGPDFGIIDENGNHIVDENGNFIVYG